MRYLPLLLMLLPSGLLAQTDVQPKITVETPTEAVTVGQPALVRIKVLVPTFMPEPPVFPSMEQENLLVRLPERATGPISETVEGETWSGVQRSYRLYPLNAGQVDLGPQSIGVTFADPDTNAPVKVSVELPNIRLTADVPDAARNLNPLIIATGFGLDQQIEGETDMQFGGAVTRRLTAKITGTTPMLVPDLIPVIQDPLLKAYPKEPRFTESEDRGILSGQREDEVVYLAQDGGETQLSAISVQWYNLSTNQVETIEIDAIDLTLAPPKWTPPDARTLATIAIWAAVAALGAWAFVRWSRPRVVAWHHARREKYLSSPAFALKRLKEAIQQRNLSAAYAALDLWKARAASPATAADLERELTQIGAARYSVHALNTAEHWQAAKSALGLLGQSHRPKTEQLPPLNP
ncbi:MAG: hypothetical protein AB3N19_14525 [Ruegeria sp.]